MAGGLRWLVAAAASALPIAACSLVTDLTGYTSAVRADAGPPEVTPVADATDGDARDAGDADSEADGGEVSCRPGLTGPTCAIPCPPGKAGRDCEFERVFRLEIPTEANWRGAEDIPYSEDKSASVATFTRVAYRLALDDEEVWVEVDAFTAEASRLAVPIDWVFEGPVRNVVVRSFAANQPDVLGPASGSLEFWPHCYAAGDDGRFDHADVRYDPPRCYGSMQIHVEDRPVLCFNRWSSAEAALDLGIGPAPRPDRVDWTFAENSGTFTTRTLEVYVR